MVGTAEAEPAWEDVRMPKERVLLGAAEQMQPEVRMETGNGDEYAQDERNAKVNQAAL